VDFHYYPSVRHNVKFGIDHIYHAFTPSSSSAKQGDVVFNTGEIIKQYAHESAAYVNDEFSLTEKLKINAGLRLSMFNHVGPFTRYTKDNVGSITGEINYAGGELIKTYQGLEPRLSMRYELDRKSSLKAAYTHNNQYIHLASLSSISLPTDVWVGASDKVLPLIGDQFALGYFRNLMDNRYETSVELYYKDMQNLIEYEDGFIPADNIQDNADNHFTNGKGNSYGAEFFLKKRTGDLTGWIGYTIAKTTRQFEDINGGEPFPAKYDRTHDLSVVATYDLQKKDSRIVSDSLKCLSKMKAGIGNWFRTRHWIFGGTFVYATGNSLTLPVSRYMFEGNILNEYGPRNWYRMIPYHRADISVTLKGRETKRYQSSWNFSVYNIYSRANPYFIYFDTTIDDQEGTLETKAYQVSLFPILPSITWNFSF
jgi:outer membrane receptor for monomeric catechols